ncbi:MAG: hypothetical protein K2N21_00975 [Rikenellaceae bacterium]|nr:hypothetical protein [Rikenellaceae bacterium]
MEFPAVGCRNYSVGSLYDAGAFGHYWSSVASTSNSNYAYYLYFNSSDLYLYNTNKQNGRSVRCVR